MPSGIEWIEPIVWVSASEGRQSTVFDGAGQAPSNGSRVPRMIVSPTRLLSASIWILEICAVIAPFPSGVSGCVSAV